MKQRPTHLHPFWLIVLAMVAMTAIPPAMADATPQKIQVPSQMPVGHPVTKAMDQFCQTVNEESGGMLILSHFPSGQLLTDKEVPKAVAKGTVKIAQTFLPWWSGKIPDIFPYGGKQVESYDHYRRLMDGPLGKYVAGLLEKKGRTKLIAPLPYTITAGYITNRPVHKAGDMQGLKIRIPTKVLAAEVTALGGTPTVLSSADVYMAIQRGTIQGGASGLGSFYARKWYEVAKYVFILRPVPQDFHLVCNLKWFNGLSPDLQKLLMQAGKKAFLSCEKMAFALESRIRSELQTKGVTITEIPRDRYQTEFAPLVEPALKAFGVKEFGQQLADQWDKWVEETR